MRQISISMVGGCMILYAMPIMSMELLMIEQQLSTLAHDSAHRKFDTNQRSVANLLKLQYAKLKQNNAPFSDNAKGVRVAEQLYNESIKLPTPGGHLDWTPWRLNDSPFPSENQLNALYTFGTYVDYLYSHVYYLIKTYDLDIDNLEQTIQFNDLVTLLESSLPPESNREKTNKKLTEMWLEVKQIDNFFAGRISLTSKQVNNFLMRYPDVFLWTYYFYFIFGFPLSNNEPSIIFEALYFDANDIEKNYPRIGGIVTWRLLSKALQDTYQGYFTKFSEKFDELLKRS
jgi:hypothetical protein